jgi:hypothetical protein
VIAWVFSFLRAVKVLLPDIDMFWRLQVKTISAHQLHKFSLLIR